MTFPSSEGPSRCRLCGASQVAHLAHVSGGYLVRGRACHLIYLDPPLHAAFAEYYDLVYADLRAARHTTRRRRPLFEDFLLREPAVAGGRLLDIGCGDGTFLRLAGQHRWDAWGVETSTAAVAAARRWGPNVELSRISADGIAQIPFTATASTSSRSGT